MLRILKMEPSIKVLKHCYTLISNVEREPSIPWFFTFSTRLKGFVKGTFQGKSTHVKKWRGK
jgi:hypothetical protein